MSPAWCNWIQFFFFFSVSLLVAHFTFNQHKCRPPSNANVMWNVLKLFFFSFFIFHRKHYEKFQISGYFFRALLFFCVHSMQMMHNNNEVSECLCSTYLLQYWSDVFQRQRRKLILLQEVVQILLEHFKHQTRVILVLEAFEGSHKIELVSIFLA